MNPLLQPSSLKNGALPLDQIKPEHFAPAVEASITKGQKVLAELKAKPASFDNTFRGLESCAEDIENVYTIFSNLLSANANEDLQKLAVELGPKVASFSNDVLLDEAVFASVREVFNHRKSLALNAEQIQLVEKIYRDFERNGAGLVPQQKDRLRTIDERLSQLMPMFRENVLK